jgi:demethylmenaquinone methyltransferase/2-methoxy-6-polyprenyl-1,4-benzoquinol methylase
MCHSKENPMEKKAVIEFFDRCAPWWDADMIRNEDIISTILTLGGIRKGMDVLDVACGTGVLFPDYFQRQVASLTAIDISPEMAKIAASKFPQANVICGDVEEVDFEKQFDAVMVYNAFPHFPDPAKLVKRLAELTKTGGRLSVAPIQRHERVDWGHAGAEQLRARGACALELRRQRPNRREPAGVGRWRFGQWVQRAENPSAEREIRLFGRAGVQHRQHLRDHRQPRASRGRLLPRPHVHASG